MAQAIVEAREEGNNDYLGHSVDVHREIEWVALQLVSSTESDRCDGPHETATVDAKKARNELLLADFDLDPEIGLGMGSRRGDYLLTGEVGLGARSICHRALDAKDRRFKRILDGPDKTAASYRDNLSQRRVHWRDPEDRGELKVPDDIDSGRFSGRAAVQRLSELDSPIELTLCQPTDGRRKTQQTTITRQCLDKLDINTHRERCRQACSFTDVVAFEQSGQGAFARASKTSAQENHLFIPIDGSVGHFVQGEFKVGGQTQQPVVRLTLKGPLLERDDYCNGANTQRRNRAGCHFKIEFAEVAQAVLLESNLLACARVAKSQAMILGHIDSACGHTEDTAIHRRTRRVDVEYFELGDGSLINARVSLRVGIVCAGKEKERGDQGPGDRRRPAAQGASANRGTEERKTAIGKAE